MEMVAQPLAASSPGPSLETGRRGVVSRPCQRDPCKIRNGAGVAASRILIYKKIMDIARTMSLTVSKATEHPPPDKELRSIYWHPLIFIGISTNENFIIVACCLVLNRRRCV